MEVDELVNKLYSQFSRIWRCADSFKWELIKETDLLSFDWINNEINYKGLSKKEIGKGHRAIFPFVNDLKIGDLIFVMSKNKIFGIAICKSEYAYKGLTLNLGDNKPAVRVDYIYKSQHGVSHPLKTHNNPSTFARIDQYKFGLTNTVKFLYSNVEEAYDSLVHLVNEPPKMVDQTTNDDFYLESPLNQIFFGPPGTGKTYHTVNEALRIVGVKVDGLIRTELKEEFDKRLNAGQIIFTTFHQSMSYEDFIEGIKPNLDDGDLDEENGTEIEYVVKPGIFKRISERARNSISSKYSFDDLWTEYYNDLISKGAVEFTSVSSELKLEPSESKMERLGVRFKKSYDPDAAEGKKVFPVSKNIIKKLFDNQIDAKETHARQEIRTIVGGGRATTYYAVYKSFYDFVSSKGKLNSKKQNYVLIIDEINRGNVSQIFGELITLIEKDKRLGKEEELKVTLPYSNDKFGVPSNLYIIGTMNTADRSVEALDTALRRRFSFREMPPIYNLEGLNYEYAEVKGSDILKTINRRIEKLLDRDHLIGHSFFLLGKNEDPETKLIQSFYQNLIPLLQEYFYGDYAKIGAVLGSGFVTKQEDFSQIEFAKGFIDEDDSEKDIFQIIDYRPDHPGNNYAQPGMTFQKAILHLMNRPT